MNSKGIIALTDTTVCMQCLKKKATHTYSIYGRGYGSDYDNFNSKFQLCDDCAKDEYKTWTDEECHWEGEMFCGEVYKYEGNISALLKSFPLEAKELFYNRFATGANADTMKPQDWIDFQVGELSYKKCKEYCLISPQEERAYKERFPNCACVTVKKYKDGSQGSKCPYGAFGDEIGNADSNTSCKCYMCSYYKPREGDINIIDETTEYYKNEKYRLIHMLQYASTRLRELEDSVEEYMKKHDS